MKTSLFTYVVNTDYGIKGLYYNVKDYLHGYITWQELKDFIHYLD